MSEAENREEAEQEEGTGEVEGAVEDTVEIIEPNKEEKSDDRPTKEALLKQGWSKEEIKKAEERGLIQESKKSVSKSHEKSAEEDKKEAKSDRDDKEDAPRKAEEEDKGKKYGQMPDFELTPEQEEVFSKVFPPGTPVRGVFYRMKNERKARQQAQAEVKELRDKLDKLTESLTQKKVEVDEEGNQIDPDEKPLTVKALKEMQDEERMLREKVEMERSEKAQVLAEAHRDQEEYARESFPDFDEKIALAREVMTNPEKHIREPWKMQKLKVLVQNLQIAAENAHKYEVDGYNAATIAYEIGSMAVANDINGKSDPKENGNPKKTDAMKRIIKNTHRRQSSASLTGGSKSVPVSEVTGEMLNSMSIDQRLKFKESHPEKYRELVYG